jgi:cytidylate kinase
VSRARDGLVVTVDGPAGSGKSTTAREVARRLGFRHLDSGALYRALTYALLDAGIPVESWPDLTRQELEDLGVSVEPTPTGFDVTVGDRVLESELRTQRVTAQVSQLSSFPAVREALLGLQRAAGRHGRLVADGRDMGTVVFPEADVKIYLVADLPERARRRLAERGVTSPDDDVLAAEAKAISERDRRDSTRAMSPLRRPEGATLVDTTRLTIEEQVEVIVRSVRKRMAEEG